MIRLLIPSLLALSATAPLALASGAAPQMVTAEDQSVADGTVTAQSITAAENGWLVVHRTDADMTPGPVVGHAPIRKGETADVAAILTEPVAPGDMLMLMIHAERGGEQTGIFEYTLGAQEDGPIRVNGDLVMRVITAL